MPTLPTHDHKIVEAHLDRDRAPDRIGIDGHHVKLLRTAPWPHAVVERIVPPR